jgi:hypothetical protein
MHDCECEGISAQDRAFLEYLEKCFADYPDRKTAARFGVSFDKRRLAALGPGELLRYVRSSAGKGFTAEAGSRDDIMTSAPPGDPCCEWYFDEDSMQWICIAWC